jgi:hypothetical protein
MDRETLRAVECSLDDLPDVLGMDTKRRRQRATTKRRWRTARRVAGFCHDCGELTEPGKSRCARHSEQTAGALKRRRNKRRECGLCERCDNPADPGKARCARHRKQRSEGIKAIKLEVLSRYGKGGRAVCCWPGCTVSDPDMLTLDHVNDDGAKHRRETGLMGKTLYARLKRQGWPLGYQTLCGGHQWKKEVLRRRVVR